MGTCGGRGKECGGGGRGGGRNGHAKKALDLASFFPLLVAILVRSFCWRKKKEKKKAQTILCCYDSFEEKVNGFCSCNRVWIKSLGPTEFIDFCPSFLF